MTVYMRVRKKHGKRILFICGMSTLIDDPCTIECPMFRYKHCTHNEPFYMCFDLATWDSMTENEQDTLISAQVCNVKKLLGM